MDRCWMVAVALVAVVGAGGARIGRTSFEATAGILGEQDTNFTLEGKITARTEEKLTINSEGNILFHVRYGDKTEIRDKDGHAASAKVLHVGQRVRVEGDLTESGEIVAQRIEIESDPADGKSMNACFIGQSLVDLS